MFAEEVNECYDFRAIANIQLMFYLSGSIKFEIKMRGLEIS